MPPKVRELPTSLVTVSAGRLKPTPLLDGTLRQKKKRADGAPTSADQLPNIVRIPFVLEVVPTERKKSRILTEYQVS